MLLRLPVMPAIWFLFSSKLVVDTFKFGSLRLLNKLNIDGFFCFLCDASLTLRFNAFDFFFRFGKELNLVSVGRKKGFFG